MDKCNCFLGHFNGDPIYKNNIKESVHELVELQPQFKKYDLLKSEPQTAKQLVDGRKGHLFRFSYCPYCGEKFNWKQIIDEILKP